MVQGKIVFCAPTKPLLNQQVTACYNKMSVSKVQSGHTALLIARHSHFRSTKRTIASGIAFWHTDQQCQPGCCLDSSVLWPMHSINLVSGSLQEHIEELTGSVSAEKRAELWALPHKRFYFMTPQTFKNDLMKGHSPAPAAALAAHVRGGVC